MTTSSITIQGSMTVAIFDDPVAYLASLGVEAVLMTEPSLPAAA